MADTNTKTNTSAELLSVKKLAERINISPYCIREYARTGKIPSYKIGKLWLFDPIEVINVIKSKGNIN